MTSLTKLSWFLYNATTLTTLVISVAYWSLLFTPGSTFGPINFIFHGSNMIVSMRTFSSPKDLIASYTSSIHWSFWPPMSHSLPFTGLPEDGITRYTAYVNVLITDHLKIYFVFEYIIFQSFIDDIKDLRCHLGNIYLLRSRSAA